MSETPRTEADKACDAVDTLASQCKLNPTAYQRDAKEAIRQLETELQEAQKERDDLQRLFDLQHTRMVEATHAWRAANPGNDNVLPDLGKLLAWLLKERREAQEAIVVMKGALGDNCVYHWPSVYSDCKLCQALTKAKEIGL